MSINIWTDSMQHAALLGKPVLFTNWLIQRDIIPDGWYCYDLRGTHKSPSTRTTLVDHAADYHAGTVLSPIPLKHEGIVLLETMKAADKDHRVFKLQFEAGEFDMVIYDQKENSCEIFEIKHSSKQVPLQYRHLVDEDKCQRTERRFGPIQGRYILYRGEDAQMENGVQYWNVENYLKALPTLDIVQVQEIGMQPIEPTL